MGRAAKPLAGTYATNEPATTPGANPKCDVPQQGFEPRPRESESRVLPLDYRGVLLTCTLTKMW